MRLSRMINLAVKDTSGGFTPIPIACEVFGDTLAIHLDVNNYGAGRQGPKYSISHVRTGLGILHGLHKKDVYRIVDFLLSVGAEEWEFGEFGMIPTREEDKSGKVEAAWRLKNKALEMVNSGELSSAPLSKHKKMAHPNIDFEDI